MTTNSSHGISMDRDPAPGRHVPAADSIPLQPLSEIVVNPPPRPTRIPTAPPAPARPTFDVTIDGTTVTVAQGATLLDACRAQGLDIPTLCYLDTLTPVNVCRVCVVEIKGSRVLAPACSRKAEPGMDIQTDSERV